MRVFLTGFMGAGKSTLGRRLAHRLERPFRDLDQEVEAYAGCSIPEIFATSGEAAFRRQELAALTRLLEDPELTDLVLATGGGTAAQPDAAALLRGGGTTVWLDVPFDLVARRLGSGAGTDRPLFADRAAARELYEQRRSAYAEAELHLEIGGEEPVEEVVGRLAGMLRRAWAGEAVPPVSVEEAAR